MTYLTYALLALSFFLFILVIRLFVKKKEADQALHYMTAKIHDILANQSKERIFMLTSDKTIQELLVAINRLLDYHQEYMADTSRLRLSTNRMLSNISHDLKTPITVILGYIETILNDHSLKPEERDVLLSKAHERVINLTNLIHQFFDMAKLEAKDWPLELQLIHINELCRQLIVGYYDILTRKGIAINITIPDEPLFIRVDESAMLRILNNLLSNAISYGKDGQTIGLTVRRDSESVFIDVWDQGKGISNTQLNKIFDRLYTVSDSWSSSNSGSGIGLAIVKGLTEQMNGRINVDSTPNVRTTFTLSFKKERNENEMLNRQKHQGTF